MHAKLSRGLGLACLFAMAPAVAAEPASMPAPPSKAECGVWQRERSFAQSVADHDAAAFAEHLHAGAVFVGGPQPLRGADAVAAGWAGIVRGDRVRLHWAPDQVVVGGDPDTALSMGPFWMEDPTATAEPRWRTGRFISTWRRDRRGVWHVLFDGGGGNTPVPATTADVDALRAALPQVCAAG